MNEIMRLHNAAILGHVSIMRVLLEAGFDPDTDWTREYISPRGPALHIAAERDRIDMIDLLLKHGATVDLTDEKGMTALERAIINNAFAAAEHLICRGAGIRANRWGGSLLHFIAGHTGSYTGTRYTNAEDQHRGQVVSVVELLVKRGLDANEQTSGGDAPLHLALKTGNHFLFDRLIAAGADPHRVDGTGTSPLEISVNRGSME